MDKGLIWRQQGLAVLMVDPEFALVETIAHGDEKAFEALLKRYQGPLFNFGYRYIGDFGAAEDLTQEVLRKS